MSKPLPFRFQCAVYRASSGRWYAMHHKETIMEADSEADIEERFKYIDIADSIVADLR